MVDHDVRSVGEEPALWLLHEGALPADGAGLQEPVECPLVLTAALPSASEFATVDEHVTQKHFVRMHFKTRIYRSAWLSSAESP